MTSLPVRYDFSSNKQYKATSCSCKNVWFNQKCKHLNIVFIIFVYVVTTLLLVLEYYGC